MTQEEFFKRYSYTPSKDRIGGGNFGTVYKAKDNVLHREVAIKVSEVKTSPDGKKTFSLKDEFEALAHVPKHPNIANYEEFYSFEMPNGIFDYAVMQYYPDGNLSNAIKEGLTDAQKEDIATQLLEGIAFLHHHKVVHRDLKPGNILIVKDGGKVIPLITDFGLSKAAGVVDGSVFSNSFGAGTPRYSSPEQLQGNPLRFNTDLWSYGAILYELFTGTQLFTAGSGAANTAQADMEIYNKIVNGNVQSLGKMPEMWRKVAERCLVVDPTKRAKDAAELFAIIRSDEDETEIGDSGSVGVGASASKRTEPPPKDKPIPKKTHSGTPPSNGAGEIPKPPAGSSNVGVSTGSTTAKPKPKKALWIGLGIAAAVIVALLVLFLKPKQEPTPTDPDTQAYEACQTVADYRSYLSDYGRNALHYSDAKAFVDRYVADSIEQARQAQAQPQTQQQSGNGSVGGHEYVDLGLPSGTLWAACNVGANKPEDYGNYYAWGETSTKSTYNWDTYNYAKGANDKLTKYCNKSGSGNNGFTDNLTTLQGSDDAATSNWGIGWQTPTAEQWEELLQNADNEWTTKNGVKGRLFTSKKNGQSVFLPAAGRRWVSELYYAGSYGYYWSRSLYADTSDRARRLYFSSDDCYLGYSYRFIGFSVRPVREK